MSFLFWTAVLVVLPLALGALFWVFSSRHYGASASTEHHALRQQTLKIYAVAALGLGPLYSAFFLAFDARWTAIGPGVFFLTTSTSYLLYRAGRLRASAVLLAWSIWFCPEWCVVTTGGLYSPLLIWMAPSPFMAGPLLGRRAAAVAGLASVVFCVIAGLLPASYPGPHEMNEGLGRPLLFVLCGTTAIGLIAFYSWSTTGNYEDSTSAMLEKNAALRALSTELDAGSQAMRRVLDNVAQGLLIVDEKGLIAGRWSAAIERWFGPPSAGLAFADLVARVDEKAAAMVRLGFEGLAEGFLPEEVVLEQFPRELCVAGRTVTLELRRLADGGLLAVLSDVTEAREVARAEALQASVLSLFRHFRKDRSGVLTFLGEMQQVVDCLGHSSCGVEVMARRLHTVKGNAALFGLSDLAARAHALEDELAEDGALQPASVARFKDAWSAIATETSTLVGHGAERKVEVERQDLESLARAIEGVAPRGELADRTRALGHEPVAVPLERLAEQARALSRRLGKGALDVIVEAGPLRLDRERYGPVFSAMVHLVRNAVDHGLESAEVRTAVGKAATGRLRLSAQRAGDELLVSVEDDGAGIDWERLAEAARRRGLKADSHDDRLAALFADGVSTRHEVSDVSGRGVGMGSLAHEVKALGGHLEVDSQRGRGTTFTLRLPWRSLHAPAPLTQAA